MFEISRADKTEVDAREQISEIFAEGFTQWLGYFSKDENIIAKAFAHMFVLEQFYVAIDGNKIVGMIACTNGYNPSVKLDYAELQKNFGFFKGIIARLFLKKEFEGGIDNSSPQKASIEFVGTSTNYRGKGVATQILKYILDNTSFSEYVIDEVADTNIPAISLYKKLGFMEYKRKSVSPKVAKKIGINNFVSLIYTK
ncbi:MAG: GNAT family N-acetyltransferase [Bacteroidales bacterium]|jgi:ribosomal protein S18 acetylase RimI-like enzyme|nr:GNAT family N-acetyltransferase [Bacteroidales bacterium]